jgi:hypothetical protein
VTNRDTKTTLKWLKDETSKGICEAVLIDFEQPGHLQTFKGHMDLYPP